MSGPGHVTGNRVREDERRPGFPFGGFALNDYCHPPVITAVSLFAAQDHDATLASLLVGRVPVGDGLSCGKQGFPRTAATSSANPARRHARRSLWPQIAGDVAADPRCWC
jgi:hypothetical protein